MSGSAGLKLPDESRLMENAVSIAPAYLRPADAAAYLGISPSLLAKLVRKQQGPRQRHIGRRVVYAVTDLDQFMDML